jgi:hypothetical protein
MPSSVIHFTFELPEIYGDPKKMASVFRDVQSCVQSKSTTDRQLGLTIRIASGSYRVAGYYYGSAKNYMKVDTCLDKATGKRSATEVLSFANALSTIGGRAPVKQPVNAFNTKSNFFAKSLLIPENGAPSRSAMVGYFTYMIDNGNKVRDQWVFTFRLMGGADSQVPAEDDTFSAVSDRDALWIVQHDGQIAQNPRDVTRFIEGSTNALMTAAKGNAWKSFAPFVDPTLSNTAYFSSGMYSKLRKLKYVYDKNEIFFNAQSVAPKK